MPTVDQHLLAKAVCPTAAPPRRNGIPPPIPTVLFKRARDQSTPDPSIRLVGSAHPT